MRFPARLLEGVKDVLLSRAFNERQVKNIIPRLHEQLVEEPRYLEEIVDTWNELMSTVAVPFQRDRERGVHIPSMAEPPPSSLMAKMNINMCHILGDVEPDLLLFEPAKLRMRHHKIQGLGLTNNLGEHWIILYNAPRGFYLQEWLDLSKKIYYLEQYLLDFLYDKREKRQMETHPLVKSAAVVEADFDHIRSRYLFASRSGYKALSHMFKVQTALQIPTLTDLVLTDDKTYLEKFAPFCSEEEYRCFNELIKKNDFDEDDAQIFENLAELETLDQKN